MGKSKKHKNKSWQPHVDQDWIYSKIDGHGGSYGYTHPNGFVHIGYIGHRNSLYVFWYNIILFFKYIKRLLNRIKMRL